MLKNKKFIAFLVYASLLLGFPFKMIMDQNKVFHEGTAYKFKCQPIDPSDPFRGKFVRLGFEEITISAVDDPENNSAYGIITVDASGYAQIDEVVAEYNDSRPMVEVYFQISTDSTHTYILPFDRLYMNENKAAPAEELYRNALADANQNVYAKVYVAEGRYLLDDVYVDDVPLRDAIEKE